MTTAASGTTVGDKGLVDGRPTRGPAAAQHGLTVAEYLTSSAAKKAATRPAAPARRAADGSMMVTGKLGQLLQKAHALTRHAGQRQRAGQLSSTQVKGRVGKTRWDNRRSDSSRIRLRVLSHLGRIGSGVFSRSKEAV